MQINDNFLSHEIARLRDEVSDLVTRTGQIADNGNRLFGKLEVLDRMIAAGAVMPGSEPLDNPPATLEIGARSIKQLVSQVIRDKPLTIKEIQLGVADRYREPLDKQAVERALESLGQKDKQTKAKPEDRFGPLSASNLARNS